MLCAPITPRNLYNPTLGAGLEAKGQARNPLTRVLCGVLACGGDSINSEDTPGMGKGVPVPHPALSSSLIMPPRFILPQVCYAPDHFPGFVFFAKSVNVRSHNTHDSDTHFSTRL